MMQKRLVVEFGRGKTKLAVVTVAGGHSRPQIEAFAILASVLTAEDPQALSQGLSDFSKTNAPDVQEAVVVISDPDAVFIKHMIFPALPDSEIAGAVHWRLKEEAIFANEEIQAAWQVFRRFTDEEGAKKIELVLAAALSRLVRQAVAVVSACGLLPVVVTTPPFVYAGWLGADAAASPNAVLDIGFHQATLNIYQNGQLCFSRSLGFSADKLTQSLTSALQTEAGRIALSYAEAEALKQAVGIPIEGESISSKIPSSHLGALMRPFLEGLSREIRRSLDYFTLHFKQENPSRLYLVGGGAKLKNLASHLAAELKMEVMFLPCREVVAVSPIDSPRFAEEELLLSAVVAACIFPSPVNLLPEELKTQKLEIFERISLRLIAITLGVMFLVSFLFLQLQKRDYERRLFYAQQQLKSRETQFVLKEKIDLKEGLIRHLREGHLPLDGLLKLLSHLVPRSLLLDELVFQKETSLLVLKGRISVGQEAAEIVLVNFMKKLEDSIFVKEAELSVFKAEPQDYTFEIRCDLRTK